MCARLELQAIILLWMLGSVSAKWNTSVTVNLGWPPVYNEGDVTSWPTVNAPYGVFPCEGISAAAASGPRTDFPVTGGRLQFDLVNSTGQLATQVFYVRAYFGQMSVDASADQSGWAGISTPYYRDFTTSSDCTYPIDVASVLQDKPYFTSKVGYDSKALEGANVTLGLAIWLSGPNNGDNIGEIYQCSYLRLVAADAPATQDRGMCNTGVSATPSTTSLTTTSSIGAVPTPTSSRNPAVPTASPGSKQHLSRNSIIGIAIGVTIALAAVVLVAGYVMFRRRRPLRPTVALDFWVNGMPWRTRHHPPSAEHDSLSSEKGKLDVKTSIIDNTGPDGGVKTKLDKHVQVEAPDQKAINFDKKGKKLSNGDDNSNSNRDSIGTRSEADTLPPYENARKNGDEDQIS